MVEMKAVDGTLAFACEGKKSAVYEETLLLLATALNNISEGDEEELKELIEITREALPGACRDAALIGKLASIDKI